MAFLLLTIICTTCLILFFKVIEKTGTQKLPTIVLNYATCVLLGFIMHDELPELNYVLNQSWFPYSMFLGAMFILIFYMVGLSTQLQGITSTAVAFKISLVIPVVAAFFLYGDTFTPIKITGIILTIPAMVLTSIQGKSRERFSKYAILPFIVFMGSGIIDGTVNYVQAYYLTGITYSSFLLVLFGTSTLLGTFALLILSILKGVNITYKEVIGGIILGIPNYFSIHYTIKALEFSGLQSSTIYPLINIGIIALSTLMAYLIFRERLTAPNLLGLVISILAIIFISISA